MPGGLPFLPQVRWGEEYTRALARKGGLSVLRAEAGMIPVCVNGVGSASTELGQPQRAMMQIDGQGARCPLHRRARSLSMSGRLTAALFFLAGCATPRGEPADACAGFEEAVSRFRASLVAEDGAPPRIDPQRSPVIAREMLGLGNLCLKRRGVNGVVEGNRLRINPNAGPLPTSTAADVAALTGGAVVYDIDFFLAKPYAAAAFDKTANVLFLPHGAIAGREDKALRHEMRHVHSLSLRHAHPRARHVAFKNADTKPDILDVDEVFAYAAGAYDGIDDEERVWSRQMAERYIGFARSALGRPDTVLRLDALAAWCAPSPAVKLAVEEALDCVASHLGSATTAALDACDAAALPPACEAGAATVP